MAYEHTIGIFFFFVFFFSSSSSSSFPSFDLPISSRHSGFSVHLFFYRFYLMHVLLYNIQVPPPPWSSPFLLLASALPTASLPHSIYPPYVSHSRIPSRHSLSDRLSRPVHLYCSSDVIIPHLVLPRHSQKENISIFISASSIQSIHHRRPHDCHYLHTLGIH